MTRSLASTTCLSVRVRRGKRQSYAFRTEVGRQIDRNRLFPLLIDGKPGIERQNWTMSDFPF